jgi:hypothetical protein
MLFKRKSKNNEIVFINTSGFMDLEQPLLASTVLPEWYKKHSSYLSNDKKNIDINGNGNSTAKKCIPIFDAMTAGYLILLAADVWVSIKENEQCFTSNFDLVEKHSKDQALDHPKSNNYDYPKIINSWGIKTPKGYSTLFIQPMHRDSVFTILPGIVDTDKYVAPVNFPMVLNDPNFEGLIPKGTPVAQVIPFKRDDWQIKFGGIEDFKEYKNVTTKLKTVFFEGYKTMFRTIKKYG